MSNIYVFGCSHTEIFKEDASDEYKRYKEYKGGVFPKTWSELLSEKMGYNLINLGEGASGNEHIFHKVCKLSNQFTSDDIVIIEWSYMTRFRIVDANGDEWKNVSMEYEDENISKETSRQIAINRSYDFFIEIIDDYENILNRLSECIGFQLYYWSVDYRILNHKYKKEKENKRYLDLDFVKDGDQIIFRKAKDMGGLEIIYETDGLIEDYHNGEELHRLLSEIFYEEILKRQ